MNDGATVDRSMDGMIDGSMDGILSDCFGTLGGSFWHSWAPFWGLRDRFSVLGFLLGSSGAHCGTMGGPKEARGQTVGKSCSWAIPGIPRGHPKVIESGGLRVAKTQ